MTETLLIHTEHGNISVYDAYIKEIGGWDWGWDEWGDWWLMRVMYGFALCGQLDSLNKTLRDIR